MLRMLTHRIQYLWNLSAMTTTMSIWRTLCVLVLSQIHTFLAQVPLVYKQLQINIINYVVFEEIILIVKRYIVASAYIFLFNLSFFRFPIS